MARSMLWTALGSLIFTASFSWGQTTPSAWPTPNPVRPEIPSNAGDTPAYQPNYSQGNQYPAATQSNNSPDNRYPAIQPGNAAGGTRDNRSPQFNQPGQPDQPVYPQIPTLQRRVPPQPQPAAAAPPPFQLTPAEQAQVDQLLLAWERNSRNVKSFDTKFVRFEYDLTYPVVDPKAPPGAQPLPNGKDQGILKYSAPDKGIYRVTYTEQKGKWEPTPPERIEHWLCDGNAVYVYKYPIDPMDPKEPKKPGQVIEYPLPPEMKGKAIADGPLPFLFGAEAKKLRERYYFKVIPAANPQKEVWLDAYPKFQRDAANFSCAQVVLNLPDMTPKALRQYLPGGKNYYSYVFFDSVVNDKLGIFQGNPFQAYTPRGWQKVTEPQPSQNGQPPQPAQAGRSMGQTR